MPAGKVCCSSSLPTTETTECRIQMVWEVETRKLGRLISNKWTVNHVHCWRLSRPVWDGLGVLQILLWPDWTSLLFSRCRMSVISLCNRHSFRRLSVAFHRWRWAGVMWLSTGNHESRVGKGPEMMCMVSFSCASFNPLMGALTLQRNRPLYCSALIGTLAVNG